MRVSRTINALSRVFTITLTIMMIGCETVHIDTLDVLDRKKVNVIDEYKVGVDDIVSVSVWRNADLNVAVPVRPDGKISVPLVGDVQAGGKSTTAISQEIESSLRKYIRDPNVTVIVTELRSHEYLSRVRVTGAVNTQVSIQYRQGMTVLDAILAAGGLNDFASANKTRLYRKVDDKTYILQVLLDDILYDGELSTNLSLSPGDIISVPERLF